MDNASKLSEDEINNTDTLNDVHDEGDSGNNQDSSSTIAITQPTSKKSRSARGDEPPPKRAKVTGSHILAESIVAVVEEMRASRKDRQAAIEACGKLDVAAALELSKTQVEAAQNLHKSQIEAAKHLHESQVAQARTSTEKALDELIDRYTGEGGLLMKGLELMRNEHNVIIFISLSKVPNVQKQWLVTECNK